MIEMESAFLRDVMPQNLLADEGVRDAAAAIDTELKKVSELFSQCLLIARIDELPSEIIDILARQWHVDFYDDTFPVEIKRNLVKSSIAWHRHKGTPWAVEEVCKVVFKNARVYENWEYGGEPYHFQIRMIEEAVPDEKVIDNLHHAIAETKNTRSWLDELSFYREIYGKLFFMNVVVPHKTVTIYPAAFPDQKASSIIYTGVGINYHKRVEVY